MNPVPPRIRIFRGSSGSGSDENAGVTARAVQPATVEAWMKERRLIFMISNARFKVQDLGLRIRDSAAELRVHPIRGSPGAHD